MNALASRVVQVLRQVRGPETSAAVFEATALPYPGALPSWRDRFEG